MTGPDFAPDLHKRVTNSMLEWSSIHRISTSFHIYL